MAKRKSLLDNEILKTPPRPKLKDDSGKRVQVIGSPGAKKVNMYLREDEILWFHNLLKKAPMRKAGKTLSRSDVIRALIDLLMETDFEDTTTYDPETAYKEVVAAIRRSFD